MTMPQATRETQIDLEFLVMALWEILREGLSEFSLFIYSRFTSVRPINRWFSMSPENEFRYHLIDPSYFLILQDYWSMSIRYMADLKLVKQWQKDY